MQQLYFTPGPSALYYTVDGHMKSALKAQIPSISHRSKAFEAIYAHTTNHLRQLLNVPSDYEILYTASATEIWERLIQNCVETSSFHLVNGSFSKRFCEISNQLGKQAYSVSADDGNCVDIDTLQIPDDVELIAATQNETSTGAAQPLEDIYAIREKYPNKILAVDCVSAYPFLSLDLNQVDAAYFSVQKGFGLPAGLGVWIVNQKCINKAQALLSKGNSIGSYHSLPALLSKAKQNQTPETPNVLGLYLLGKVAEDMLNKGVQQIKNETIYKAAITYNMLKENEFLSPFVNKENNQSKTVIVAKSKANTDNLVEYLNTKKMIVGKGYGKYKNEHIRIANFPTHSKEQFELLVDTIEGFAG